jgi:hypothetical protein
MRTTLVGLGLALAVSLTGCITVHGERAEVPAIEEAEAEKVLAHYLEVKNEANPTYDAELTATIEIGTLGEINGAGQLARSRVYPEGNPDYVPLEFSDTRFLIPRQAGWPKFFVADTVSNRGDTRWLLVFTRDSVDANWHASYLTLIEPDRMPEFIEDKDGYVQPVAASDGAGLAMSPAELAESYAAYLQDGAGSFAEGKHTSELRAARAEAGEDPLMVIQRSDQAATEAISAPLALRTTEGALALFSTRHHQKQNWAEGETPVVPELIEALMEGTATRAVTIKDMAMQSAVIPAEDAPIDILFRLGATVGATGE